MEEEKFLESLAHHQMALVKLLSGGMVFSISYYLERR